MFLRVAAGLAGALSLLSCGAADTVPVTVNERMFLRMGDTLISQGGGCMSFALPASSGGEASGGGNGDISGAEGPEGLAFVIRVFSGQELLATRAYTVGMLRSGRVDEFMVTAQSGAVYVFRYWGGSCANLDASSPDS